MAIAALGAVAIALLATLLLDATQILAKSLASIFSGFNFSILGRTVALGDHIASFVDSQAAAAIHGIESYLDSHIGALIDPIQGPTNQHKNIFGRIATALGAAATALNFIRGNRIPALINLINARFKAAEDRAALQYRTNYARILHYYDLARAHTDHADNVLYRNLTGQVAHAEAEARAGDAHQHDVTTHYYRLSIAHTDDGIAEAIRRADTVKIAAETFTTAAIGQAVKVVEGDITRQVAPVAAEAGDIGRKLDTYLKDCGEPLCNGLSDLAKDLPKLRDLLQGAAFLAFVEQMIEDPERTAVATEDTLGALFDGTVTTFRDLVGV